MKLCVQYKNNVQDIYSAKMTYKHLKYVHDHGRVHILSVYRSF